MAINAGVFNTDDNSCIGVVISDGVVVTDHVDHMYSGSADVLGINASGDLASYAYEMTTAEMLAAGVVGAVSGKNTLITNYAKYDLDLAGELLGDTSLCTAKHPRTAIGQYKNGDYMVFTCGGRETNQAGMTCAEMQDIFVAEGLKYAYNLDGGGSCNMMFFKKELAPYTEGRADPSYIVFN
jgi:exopolysaccharide biosynthesis protein